MPFSYAVPLSTFQSLLDEVDPALRGEMLARLKTEIHADLARRMTGPDMATPTGWARTYFDSTIAHGDMIFYSPMDYAQVVEKTGAPRPTLASVMFPRPGMMQDPQATLIIRNRAWRYPGGGGGGTFSQAVNTVLARSRPIIKEFKERSKELRQ